MGNLNSDEVPELALWFCRGLSVSDKPIFDGICAQCGALLFGKIGHISSLSNKMSGPPINRDGLRINDSGAQPPFLLRYSLSFFAAEAPAMFEHDPQTNCLSLKMREPWLRIENKRQVDLEATWLYCTDCHKRYFVNNQRRSAYIPFRDRASQWMMRAPAERIPVERQPEEEPCEEEEDTQLPPMPPVDEDLDADDEDVELPILEDTQEEEPDEPGAWPTLAEYEAKWSAQFEQHSLVVPGDFGPNNLVPEPVPQLWQNVPHVPFDKLKSDDSQSRLSRCRPVSGMIPSNIQDGVVQYAHHTGEVNFRRRHPLQLASTLGFVLNNNSGKFLGLTQEERAALHECLRWLRAPGNNSLCIYGQEMESFDAACKKLMSRIKQIIPEGCPRARIRATARCSRSLQDGELADTLGFESRGMVVLDCARHT